MVLGGSEMGMMEMRRDSIVGVGEIGFVVVVVGVVFLFLFCVLLPLISSVVVVVVVFAAR
jgi:hypothetical protein